MAQRVSISFYKDNQKQSETLVSTENPLPVETVGGVIGSNIFSELVDTSGNPIEGFASSATMATTIVSNYNPSANYQTLWLIVYTEPTPNIPTPVVVKAKIASSPEFRVAEAIVSAGTRMEIPIPGGHKDYTIYLGDPDATTTSFGEVYWKLYGG